MYNTQVIQVEYGYITAGTRTYSTYMYGSTEAGSLLTGSPTQTNRELVTSTTLNHNLGRQQILREGIFCKLSNTFEHEVRPIATSQP